MDPCTVAPLYWGADGPNCRDIINGIAFSMPFCCILLDTAIFLVVRFKITKPGIAGTPLARISQLIDNLSCMRFLQLSYNFAMSCL